METVEGGGMVVLLLSSLQSLTQLYSLAMDAHARLRTESHQAVVGACAAGRPPDTEDHSAHNAKLADIGPCQHMSTWNDKSARCPC